MARSLLPSLIACCLLPIPLAGTAAEAPADCRSDAMIIFDASGSMAATDFADGATSRIDRARQSLSKIVPEVSKARNLGLIVYGPGKNQNACRNVSLRLRPAPDTGAQIMSEVSKLIPAGRTPLTEAVRIAAQTLSPSEKTESIVLLTDGDETCSGDPCKLAKELRATRPDIIVHVIGYKLQGTAPAFNSKCLAEETGGYSLTADTVEELIAALRKTLTCPDVATKSPSSAAGG